MHGNKRTGVFLFFIRPALPLSYGEVFSLRLEAYGAKLTRFSQVVHAVSGTEVHSFFPCLDDSGFTLRLASQVVRG